MNKENIVSNIVSLPDRASSTSHLRKSILNGDLDDLKSRLDAAQTKKEFAKYDTEKPLIAASPSETLTFSIGGPQHATSLKVKNISLQKVAVKVKTTHPTSYYVKPNQYILDAGQVKEITITLVAPTQILAEADLAAHRFMVQSKQLTDSQYANIKALPTGKSHEELARLWSIVDKHNRQDLKLKVDFVKVRNAIKSESQRKPLAVLQQQQKSLSTTNAKSSSSSSSSTAVQRSAEATLIFSGGPDIPGNQTNDYTLLSKGDNKKSMNPPMYQSLMNKEEHRVRLLDDQNIVVTRLQCEVQQERMCGDILRASIDTGLRQLSDARQTIVTLQSKGDEKDSQIESLKRKCEDLESSGYERERKLRALTVENASMRTQQLLKQAKWSQQAHDSREIVAMSTQVLGKISSTSDSYRIELLQTREDLEALRSQHESLLSLHQCQAEERDQDHTANDELRERIRQLEEKCALLEERQLLRVPAYEESASTEDVKFHCDAVDHRSSDGGEEDVKLHCDAVDYSSSDGGEEDVKLHCDAVGHSSSDDGEERRRALWLLQCRCDELAEKLTQKEIECSQLVGGNAELMQTRQDLQSLRKGHEILLRLQQEQAQETEAKERSLFERIKELEDKCAALEDEQLASMLVGAQAAPDSPASTRDQRAAAESLLLLESRCRELEKKLDDQNAAHTEESDKLMDEMEEVLLESTVLQQQCAAKDETITQLRAELELLREEAQVGKEELELCYQEQLDELLEKIAVLEAKCFAAGEDRFTEGQVSHCSRKSLCWRPSVSLLEKITVLEAKCLAVEAAHRSAPSSPVHACDLLGQCSSSNELLGHSSSSNEILGHSSSSNELLGQSSSRDDVTYHDPLVTEDLCNDLQAFWDKKQASYEAQLQADKETDTAVTSSVDLFNESGPACDTAGVNCEDGDSEANMSGLSADKRLNLLLGVEEDKDSHGASDEFERMLTADDAQSEHGVDDAQSEQGIDDAGLAVDQELLALMEEECNHLMAELEQQKVSHEADVARLMGELADAVSDGTKAREQCALKQELIVQMSVDLSDARERLGLVQSELADAVAQAQSTSINAVLREAEYRNRVEQLESKCAALESERLLLMADPRLANDCVSGDDAQSNSLLADTVTMLDEQYKELLGEFASEKSRYETKVTLLSSQLAAVVEESDGMEKLCVSQHDRITEMTAELYQLKEKLSHSQSSQGHGGEAAESEECCRNVDEENNGDDDDNDSDCDVDCSGDDSGDEMDCNFMTAHKRSGAALDSELDEEEDENQDADDDSDSASLMKESRDSAGRDSVASDSASLAADSTRGGNKRRRRNKQARSINSAHSQDGDIATQEEYEEEGGAPVGDCSQRRDQNKHRWEERKAEKSQKNKSKQGKKGKQNQKHGKKR